jgi:hypothetical protein
MNYLSPACAKEESKLQALEYRDIRLKPKLAKVCSEERAVYCKVGCGCSVVGVSRWSGGLRSAKWWPLL